MMKFNITKIKENLKKDNGIKLIAFIFAIIIWMFVTISLYPDTTVTIKDIDVAINVDDTYVNEMGLNVVSGEGQKVTAKIKGNRSQIGSLNASDFKAEVSLDDIKSAAEYELSVVVTALNSDVKYEVVDVNPSKIKVKFDNVVSKTFTIEPKTTATIPNGYIMGTPECSPKVLKITGPEQQINKISSCVAYAESGLLNETKSIASKVLLYDSEKNLIENKYFTFSTTDINVTVPVYQKKTVPLDLVFRNIPNGFDMDKMNYSLSADSIEIAATEEVASQLNSISLSYIDFRQIGIGSTFTINVEVPSGVQNISGIENVEVSFPEEGYASKVFSVSDISILNAPSGYDISLLTSRLQKVTIVGLKDDINSLTVNDIVAEIDLSSIAITEGTQTVAVNIYIPNKGAAWANGSYSATINAHVK